MRTDFSSRPVFDQAALRERRRKHQSVILGAAFDLGGEVHDIVASLAARIAARPRPAFYAPEVNGLAGAVGVLVREVHLLIVTADAQRATAHLRVADRGRATKLLIDLSPKPADPEIGGESLADGSWAAVLTEYVRCYSGPLADLLGRAKPRGTTRGALSVSERVEAALREVDTAAAALANKLKRNESARPPTPPGDPAEAARVELAALGVEAP